MATSSAVRPSDLRRVNCTEPGRGPWRLVFRPERRCYQLRHRRTRSTHTIYYGTRTERTREDAEQYAIALCALLNALKAKRI
jgi:hypothetical protein